MSARKPIARMDSPATTTAIATATSTPTTDAIDDAPLKIAIAVVTETETETEAEIETEVSKTVHIENGDKTETLIETEEDIEEKTEQTTIKEDNKTPDDGGEQLETQESETETSTVVTLGTDAKRQTRNSPMLIGSPIKKKLNDSQEQDSSAESTSTVDESQKKNDKVPIARPKKLASSSPVPPPSNRLTRKTAAQDLAANTRLTRARRGSAGMGARPETPPKRKYAPKKNIDPPAPAVKRKRSVSPKLSGDEPEIKTNKPEESDGDFEINSVIVKQEALESSEEMISDVASDITEPFPPEPTTRISLRARKSATCYSPTTRAYRRDKDNKDKSNVEAGISDAKRKRLNRVRPDEDSKDSLASSNMDEIGDIKSEEKFESEDASDITNSPIIDAVSNGPMNKPLTVDTELESPLVVEDTDTKSEEQIASTSAENSEKSNSSDKAASLSPDLVSEGISEISVKRFYKKPEFLENNLGIEKDPKLGEIVQNVAEKIEDTADGLSVSNDSIKEGELVYEEEDDASIGSIKNENDNDEDANSVSTGYISPLLVDEEEEDEEVHLSVNGDDEKGDDLMNTDEVPVAKDIELEADVLGEEAVEAPNEVPASNGLMGLKIDKVYENVKFETCDKTVGDIGEKDISTKEEEVKDVETVEIAAVEMEKELEKQEVEKMDVDELKSEKTKVEDAKKEKTETDQEENKENVELVPETVKDCAQDVNQTKTPEKERVTSISSNEQDESPSNSSKTQGEISGDGSTPSTSPQSAKSQTSVSRAPENDDRLRQKERHFKTLGLLTHKAADEAIMAKQKRRKFLHNLNGGSKKNTSASNAAASAGTAAGNAQNKSSHEYTGTLKTVIKLNRQSGGGSGVGGGNAAAGNGGTSEAKRGKNNEVGTKAATSGYGSRRQSLKMTFQKGRGRPSNAEKSGEHPANVSGEDSYYTIQNETEGAAASTAEAANGATTTATTGTTTTTTHGRKSYNRSNTTNEATHHAEHSESASTSKKDEKEEILIPEKASSFKFHPGRLCQDQCYYCSGKFGLYDTPCHVGQIKSVERQQKILANEEKLTVDNCLCDACFRHVDRRANAPAYKKRLSAPGHIETARTSSNREESSNENDKSQQQETSQTANSNGNAQSAIHTCAVPGCDQKAPHSLRRKGIRKSIKKSVLNFDMSSIGTYLHLCEKHYEAVVQSSGCVLCKRRLGKNNMYHITTDTDRLEKALADMGIPVSLGQGTAVCKLCRYFANLLMKPPENGKVQKVEFVKNYKKRLLQFYNIHEKKDTSHEEEEEHDDDKGKDKSPTKKQSIQSAGKRITRKSREPADECEEPMETTEAPPSPTPSSGSSVEMISDGGMFNVDDSHQRTGSTPLSATSAELAANASNQMVLDNDVMVDYDVPTISDSSSSGSFKSTSPSPQRRKESRDQQSKLKAILQSVGTSLEDRSDISTVLRSNPNISMRELFPGEEDLGLQFKAPFGSSSAQRTPEGWTRINTFLQYDEPTRRLWEDLQKPYGNQSSFLRHLILLEKYYRNGDLILSSNASSNATVYTQTVRNRLTSYDSRSSASSSPTKELETRSRSLSVDKIQRQLSSNSVTITARPKESKSQQKKEENPQQKDGGSTTGASGGALPKSTPNSRSILKTNLMGVKSGAIEIVPLSTPISTTNSSNSSSGSSTPNDSLLLTKQQKILAAANKLMSNKQETPPSQKKATLNTTPPELISLNRRPVSASSTQQMKRPQLLPKPMNSGKPIPPNVIVLPDTLTTQERLESKSWRPTLLPVTTTAHHLNNQQGPLYQTADGRRLPALVQVQSGGRPFLISIHDYNRMCILRREKLMRDQMLKGGKGKIKGIFPPATCTPGASLKASANNALQSFNKTMQAVSSAENTAKKQRLIMSKTAVLTPIAPKPTQTTTSATTSVASTVTSTGAQQQLSQVQPTVILPAGTLQPISILSTSQTSALSPVPIFSGQVVPIINTSSTSTAPSTAGIPTNSWLWNNFPDSNQMFMNGSTSTTKESQAPTLTSMKQQHSLLMSKIPKSLTVIPQHKLMPGPTAGTSSVVGNTSKE